MLDKLKKFLVTKKLGIEFDSGFGINSDGNIAQITGNQQGKTDFVELMIIEAQATFEKDISSMPLEKSKVINENLRLKPRRLHTKVHITDYSNSIISIGTINTFQNKVNNISDVQDKLTLFRMIHDEGITCKVITMTREYENMQLINFSFTEDPRNNGRYLLVDIQWQEMMFFDLVVKQDTKRLSLTNDNGAGLKNNSGIIG